MLFDAMSCDVTRCDALKASKSVQAIEERLPFSAVGVCTDTDPVAGRKVRACEWMDG
jgi:hypothetical protein